MIIEQSLLKKAPIPLAVLDTDGVFLKVSDRWSTYFGPINKMVGKSFFETMPEVPKELESDIRHCLEYSDFKSGEARAVSENGNAVWYNWKIETITNDNDNIAGIMLVLEVDTEKKLEEEFLVNSQRVAQVGGWELDVIKNEIHWSRITKKIHGLDDDYIPNLEGAISFYKEGYSRFTISKAVNEAIEQGKPWDVELQIVTAKQEEVWVRAIGEPEIINGVCVRVIGTFQNIDRRKKAEIDYNRVSDRLALATDKAGIGIWEYDIKRNQLLWDSNMYNLYGIEESDFEGVYEAWESNVLPEDLKELSNLAKDAIKGIRNYDTSFRIKWPNGDVKWIKTEATVIRDEKGEAVKMIGVNVDITELKNTQLQLETSEKSLLGAFENSSVGMALVAKDGTFIKVNQSLCDSLGYSNEELLSLTFQDITYPGDLEIDLSLLGEVIDNKRNTYQIEKRYFDKKGQLVHTLLTVTAVKKFDGTISHFVSQIVDISSRIKAEEKLKSLLELTTNKNSSLVNFAHIVSHNLRSNAANLTMICKFLLDDELKPEEQKEMLNMLGRASDGLNETISHLNEIVQTKLESGIKLKEVSVFKTVNKVLEDINALLQENNINVNTNIPNNLNVKGVPAYIESIVMNLITNGIKYRDPKKEKRMLTVKGFVKDEFIVLSVQDNGKGIDLEKYGDKIFGMYKTFHGNEDARGIGLFITKNQIESMGGTIEVESEVGVGTTFKIMLLKV
ncbi:PAS domain-containing sensor histidine kinase [Allomuricauda sp. F6463D]|uniref:PAS domain-containing sensor histidine kinase n=1 Tax=Allomuricauda sp. F6463D TaxID=2926409 RepID=UPI001FF1F081|nr:PAS domain-containing sensor histidine kinase [Muricauda sp. F6463D]MCK0159271.1 PAS domain S-box protein [Muricauda sp. F6463D]